jgi:hypothetical protein
MLSPVMGLIHKNAFDTPAEYHQPSTLVVVGNIAGFVKVAGAVLDQGLV